jgi:cytidine deaminase
MSEIGKTAEKLLAVTLKAMNRAHVLCGFKVGAAVLAEDGEIYSGCNVESWVSGLGICAERCAINHPVLHGSRKINEVAIVVDVGSQCEPRPCGACLQYIYDFAKKPKIEIVTAKAENGRILFETVKVKALRELLPYPFRK